MSSKLSSIVLAATMAGLLGLNSNSLSAADFPIEEKLQQCEAAFKASRSETATRAEAAKARQSHFKLMVEILQNLNDQNVAAVDQNRPLSPKELTNNIRVMGHLIEMLAADHVAPTADWSYVY